MIRNFINDEVFYAVFHQSLRNLQEIYLVNNKKGANELRFIPDCGALTNLKILHLNNNKITTMKNSNTLTNVEQLDLRSNKIHTLQEFFSLNKLRWLSLSSNHLDDLEFLPNLVSLKYLGLFANFLSAKPLDLLIREIKSRCPVATHVYLFGNLYEDNDENNLVFFNYQLSNSCIHDSEIQSS